MASTQGRLFLHSLLLIIILQANGNKLAANPHIVSVQSQLLDCVAGAAADESERGPPCHRRDVANLVGRRSSSKRAAEEIINYANESAQSESPADRQEKGPICRAAGAQLNESSPTLICSPSTPAQNITQTPLSHPAIAKTIKLSLQVIAADHQNNNNNNEHQLPLGSSATLQCRFESLSHSDLSFKLKWLRALADSQVNQSISSDADSVSISSPSKLSTTKRAGGLDLDIQEFQLSDSGDYFCQAVDGNNESKILDELRVKLSVAVDVHQNEVQTEVSPFSQSNLAKLLPSLKVFPPYADVAPGETVQLACVTSNLDPDPEPHEIQWNFEAVDRARMLVEQPDSPQASTSTWTGSNQLPYNVTVLGNILIVWSFTEQHRGIYKCAIELTDFNLTAQASGELTLRPETDSAPLVYVAPELIRLSQNGSATIQCEASGYPAPELSWYRVDSLPVKGEYPAPPPLSSSETDSLMIEQIAHKDTLAYCQNGGRKCHLMATNRPGSANQVTSVSLVHIKGARAQHQGQYACRARNKHGTNQASSMVDVEFREMPFVRIPSHLRRQTINQLDNNLSPAPNVTFRCTIESGRPRPRLRWLRAINRSGSHGRLNLERNLDIYDLSKVSSATANISTRLEDDGMTLALTVSTNSLDDEGDYVCFGENELGRHSAVAQLLIRRPVSIRVVQSSPFVAKLNDSFQLDCIASGHPAPLDIEWSRPDRGAFFSLISGTARSDERAVLKFDRVGLDESGEYTCNARDPLNSSIILRDTIMVVVEDSSRANLSGNSLKIYQSQLPKLMVRPTRTTVPIGSNVTLDCLAISGLQPTIVEWIAPTIAQPNGDFADNNITFSQMSIRPYYRAPEVGPNRSGELQLLQLGSKLKILNVSRIHEGVYQCKGRNRLGEENAPALIKVADPTGTPSPIDAMVAQVDEDSANTTKGAATKSKVARSGTNIELKCQVNGVEQPATSWSREGLELPATSVQIDHNLWIQNVSEHDNGLYLCSARSKQPNHVIQARVKLIVQPAQRDNAPGGHDGFGAPFPTEALSAKIVASKSQVSVGDSLTLECIISQQQNESISQLSSEDLELLERNVVWTNFNLGQSIFQDNVYIQGNLLIIYELKPENSAIYRCNYNDLSQHIDFRLQVLPESNINSSFNYLPQMAQSSVNADDVRSRLATNYRIEFKSVPINAEIVIECPLSPNGTYVWFRRNSERVGQTNSSLTFQPVSTRDADLYTCLLIGNQIDYWSVVLHVHVPGVKFSQRSVSFATLPTISGAEHELNLELKFLPERDHGLILYNGQQQTVGSTLANRTGGDYVMLGLTRGQLEFRFELGDGPTILRSLRTLELNKWHRVLIERNRRGAVMWVDGEPPVSNSSSGKFFNLNLDSVLYIGGHQFFMNIGQQQQQQANGSKSAVRRFYGYARGFQGCISLLRISGQEVDLMGRNRSASVGLFECDKSECGFDSSTCSPQNSVCQVDRSAAAADRRPASDSRCICLTGFIGSNCDVPVQFDLKSLSHLAAGSGTQPMRTSTSTVKPATTMKTFNDHQTTKRPAAMPPSPGSCELLNPCSPMGTLECQSLSSSSSYKCHCQLGYMGETCAQVAIFSDETSVWFDQQAYLQFRLNKSEETSAHTTAEAPNATSMAKLSSQVEHQNISFNLQTRSGYGLLFYTGQPIQAADNQTVGTSSMPARQSSKSMVANQLLRLLTGSGTSAGSSDYLAIALVDGHLELSYELGSGLAIIRSSRRVNDGKQHQISVQRDGKLAKLVIDSESKYEGSSPGKLSMLNGSGDIYLGGLPGVGLARSEMSSSNKMYMSGFSGCISSVEVNSLGPINLIRSDHLSAFVSGRNLAPCDQQRQLQSLKQPPAGKPAQLGSSSTAVPYRMTSTTTPASSESDDADEM